jgi:uncharacterized repeat protein (TIGR03803 family)
MRQLNWSIKAGGALLLCAMASVASPAQTFTSLHSFSGTDGSNPQGALIQASDGNLYGTTSFGGAHSGCSIDKTTCGTVYRLTTSGTLTTVHSFDGTDGYEPMAGLIQVGHSDLYGTTAQGGITGVGTVFKINLGGKLKTMQSFDYSPQGALPKASLVHASNGKFYGTAPNGGDSSAGTVFEMTASGKLTAIYAFCLNCTNGAQPITPLIQASNGKLYGTAVVGGVPDQCGTIFEITTKGVLSLLHSFTARDGCYPVAGLVQGSDGRFYGTTSAGGTDSNNGTFFRITASGEMTTLHNFSGSDGAAPEGALVLATDGNFYGTTYAGGAYGHGTIFEVTTAGTLTTLYSFCGESQCPDGDGPAGGLIQASDGKFYGTTVYGGANNQGTIFSLDAGIDAMGTHGKIPYHPRP